MEFKDKVVLITGSSSGIGANTALRFAKEGAKLIVNFKENIQGAKDIESKIKAMDREVLVTQADISKESEAKRLVSESLDHFGTIDILINNAGAYQDGDEWNGRQEIWESTLKQNLITVMNVSKYVCEHFIEKKKGIIVTTASRYSVDGQYEALAYAAAKAAIVNITQAYAKLLSPFGRANAVSPGAVNTGYWLRAPKEELAIAKQEIPLGKLLELDDVSDAILFLASDRSKMITGENILIDGGSVRLR